MLSSSPRLTGPGFPCLAFSVRGLRSIFPGRWSWSASAWTAGPSAAAPGQLAPDHLERPAAAMASAAAAPPLGRASGPPGPWPGTPPPGPLLPARIRPPAPTIFPRDFPPCFRPGFSPVTRAAGDSPAHNARPRRSPRNAISINHRNMKSTIFMQVRLHKT